MRKYQLGKNFNTNALQELSSDANVAKIMRQVAIDKIRKKEALQEENFIEYGQSK